MGGAGGLGECCPVLDRFAIYIERVRNVGAARVPGKLGVGSLASLGVWNLGCCAASGSEVDQFLTGSIFFLGTTGLQGGKGGKVPRLMWYWNGGINHLEGARCFELRDP